MKTIDKSRVLYRFLNRQVKLQATSGAPVVNASGEVVAMNLGGIEGKITTGMGNPCSSIRELLGRAEK